MYVLQLCGVLLVGGGYGGIHNLLIAFERGYAPFKLFGVVGKGYESRHKHRGVQQISDEQSRVYLEQSAEYKYKDVHNRVHASERREKNAHVVINFRFGFDKLLVSPVKLLLFYILVCKGFHDADSAQRVLDLGVDFRLVVAVFLPNLVPSSVDQPRQPRHDGDNRKHAQCHKRLLNHEYGKDSYELQAAYKQRFGAVVGKLRYVEQIGGNPRHEGADLVFVVKTVRQQLKPAEKVPP